MTFWIITAGLAVIISVLIAQAMRAPRASGAEPAAAYDLRVYQDQLREVEKDLARGVVSSSDAERVRAEISRRILAADKALRAEEAGEDDHKGAPAVVSALLALVLIGGSIGLYTQLGAPGYGDLSLRNRIAVAEERRADRPSQAAAEASLPAPAPTISLLWNSCGTPWRSAPTTCRAIFCWPAMRPISTIFLPRQKHWPA